MHGDGERTQEQTALSRELRGSINTPEQIKLNVAIKLRKSLSM